MAGATKRQLPARGKKAWPCCYPLISWDLEVTQTAGQRGSLALAIGTVHDTKTTTNPHAPNYKAAVESPSVGNVGRTSQNYNHNGRLTWGRNREGTDNVNNPVTKLVSSS